MTMLPYPVYIYFLSRFPLNPGNCRWSHLGTILNHYRINVRRTCFTMCFISPGGADEALSNLDGFAAVLSGLSTLEATAVIKDVGNNISAEVGSGATIFSVQ